MRHYVISLEKVAIEILRNNFAANGEELIFNPFPLIDDEIPSLS